MLIWVNIALFWIHCSELSWGQWDSCLARLQGWLAQGQQIRFSGSDAHHHNGVAERSIQTAIVWARTMLLHAAVHWPAAADLQFWPLALENAVYLWNILPGPITKRLPLELISGLCNPDYSHLWCLHVCGCPTSVLDPLLQDGKKLPMWSPHSCLGCFLGYSPVHSSIVSLILNLHTDPISPQYHLVHDDWFTTVSNALSSSLTQAVWDQLISTG